MVSSEPEKLEWWGQKRLWCGESESELCGFLASMWQRRQWSTRAVGHKEAVGQLETRILGIGTERKFAVEQRGSGEMGQRGSRVVGQRDREKVEQ